METNNIKPNTKTKFKVLRIDAWNDGDLWSWNNWFTQDETYNVEYYGELNEKSAMEFFKDFCIKDGMSDKFYIDDDQYNLVLTKKENDMPCFAIVYSEEN